MYYNTRQYKNKHYKQDKAIQYKNKISQYKAIQYKTN